MGIRTSDVMLPTAMAAVGLVSLAIWAQLGPAHPVTQRIPGLDRRAEANSIPATETAVQAGQPIAGVGIPATLPGEWPCFRGSNRDGICTDSTPLARAWPSEGPPVRWMVAVAEGYAGAAISQGRVFVLDYDEEHRADTLRCLSLNDGQEIWRNGYPVPLAANHGISRTVPAVAGDLVVTLGPRCHLAAWDVATGTCHWLIDLVEKFGATVPRWYTGQCPLIDEGRLVVATGGESLLVAIDYHTGNVIWKTPNPRQWSMTHSSITPMQIAGHKTYVYCGSGGVASVDGSTGTLLGDSLDWPEQFATATSPVVLPQDRLFLSSGYGSTVGSLILQLKNAGDHWNAETVLRLPPTRFNAEQHTPVLFGEHLLGIRKRGGGQVLCLDLAGNEVWNSGADKFGHGPFLLVNDLLLALSNEGVLSLAEIKPTGYRRLSQHTIFPEGREAWGPMALAAGQLVLRDATRMACVDLRAESELP